MKINPFITYMIIIIIIIRNSIGSYIGNGGHNHIMKYWRERGGRESVCEREKEKERERERERLIQCNVEDEIFL